LQSLRKSLRQKHNAVRRNVGAVVSKGFCRKGLDISARVRHCPRLSPKQMCHLLRRDGGADVNQSLNCKRSDIRVRVLQSLRQGLHHRFHVLQRPRAEVNHD